VRSTRRSVLPALAALAVAASATACLRTPTGAAPPAATTTPASARATPTSTGPTTAASGPSRSASSTGGPGWAPFRVPASAWQTWTPVLHDVRPANEADLAAVERRSRDVLERELTATVEGDFGEYEVARGHDRVRVRFGTADRPILEVYAERSVLADPDPERLLSVPLTVCPYSERTCIAVTGKESPRDRPHLFDTITDSLVYVAAAAMTSQGSGPAFLASVRGQGLGLGTATMSSPVGTLDCIVVAQGPDELAALDGVRVQPGDRDASHGELCVDPRGLVVLSPGAAVSPVTPYTSLRTAAPTGLDRLPFPVRPYPS
jgi:hypothetical protein